jgi:hypothetical protein
MTKKHGIKQKDMQHVATKGDLTSLYAKTDNVF